ncbi:MAG: regulatory iron-sulfur-containing complex subunit RicT [Tractidigestivibacter sp.]|jgi:cell fate regulator YaaT (PSP1 superfamily)|uniref:PSP1 domain-containing protein n=1 Tax=Tractidigestivibacter sp. TaxID=2847320 RepID=UPI003D8AFC71
MPTVIPVKFKYAARDLWFDVAGTEAQEADHVICATERGHEIGIATGDAREMSQDELDEETNNAQLRPVLRVATDEDLAQAEELAQKGEDAMPTFRRLVKESGLDMKPVGVEYLFDGGKVVCYFAAEERVDFRQLVRELARELHERIDMRQIGVREETAIMGGYGHCGQELCCARFGLTFEPVSIRMAKEQDLPLNSTKISGTCGRLMCCLRYEFEAYRDFKSRAPKRNAVINTPIGKGKIVEYDTPKEELCLRLENGKQIRVPLAGMTASDAAVKKSEELGCPCRPDTVSREMLEKLDSPDVQMALAELDRKNGVVPEEESVDANDIFVEKPKRRRHATHGDEATDADAPKQGNGAAAASRVARGSGNVVSAPVSKRRRHKSRAARVAAATPEATGEQGKPSTRGAGAARTASAPSAGTSAPAPRQNSRRRHHRAASVSGTAAEQGAERQQEERRQAQQQPKRTRRRHPGDHGGAAAQQQRQQKPPAHMAQPKDAGTGAASADSTKQQDGGAPKKRHRHRGGRGRGKGGQQGQENNSQGAKGNGGAPSEQ